MGFYVNCNAKVLNTGLAQFCADMGPIAGYIITPPDFSMPEEDARTKTAFETLLSADKGERIYPFPQVLAMTDNSEDTVFEELALGTCTFVTVSITYNSCTNRAVTKMQYCDHILCRQLVFCL